MERESVLAIRAVVVFWSALLLTGASAAEARGVAPAPREDGWGQPVEGVSCRLRADQQIWPEPRATFKIDLDVTIFKHRSFVLFP